MEKFISEEIGEIIHPEIEILKRKSKYNRHTCNKRDDRVWNDDEPDKKRHKPNKPCRYGSRIFTMYQF